MYIMHAINLISIIIIIATFSKSIVFRTESSPFTTLPICFESYTQFERERKRQRKRKTERERKTNKGKDNEK